MIEYWHAIFEECPDSQIDIKISMSSSGGNFVVIYTIKGIDEFGNDSIISSGAVSSLVVAGKEIADALRDRAGVTR